MPASSGRATSCRRVRCGQVGGRGGPSRERGGAWWGRERASHHRRLAAGPLAHDRRLVALRAHAWSRSVTSSVLTWLELDVWLARSLPRYAARNFSIEKTVPRDSM